MFSIVKHLSVYLGASEASLKLLLTIFAGYPVAYIYRKYYFGKSSTQQHLFFIITGFLLGCYNYGFDILHTTATMLCNYIIMLALGPSLFTAVTVLLFNMSYLMIGYIITETESYDIIWTMPQCILVLRLSGLAFDIYDGAQATESTKDVRRSHLKELPSLLEVAAYSYFPTTFLVGPQFPLRRYRDLINGKCKDPNEELPGSVDVALKKLALGLMYVVIFTVGSVYYSTDFLSTYEFQSMPYLRRIWYTGLWAHIHFYKYISCWLLAEGSCIFIGIGYNGKDSNGKVKWDGSANVDIYLYETAQNFSKDYVHSFNINTNAWVFNYVFKRLKFLGNKMVSQFSALMFLAVWHGLHSGYYMSFLLEFTGVVAEKDFEVILNRNKIFLEWLEKPIIKQVKWLVLKYYALVVMGPCLVPFVVLSYDKWLPIHRSVWFLPHLVWIGYPLYRPLLKKLLPPKRDE